MDTLNAAIMQLYSTIPSDQWEPVAVRVDPTAIVATDLQASDDIITECRVRFLSFMGIAKTNSR